MSISEVTRSKAKFWLLGKVAANRDYLLEEDEELKELDWYKLLGEEGLSDENRRRYLAALLREAKFGTSLALIDYEELGVAQGVSYMDSRDAAARIRAALQERINARSYQSLDNTAPQGSDFIEYSGTNGGALRLTHVAEQRSFTLSVTGNFTGVLEIKREGEGGALVDASDLVVFKDGKVASVVLAPDVAGRCRIGNLDTLIKMREQVDAMSALKLSIERLSGAEAASRSAIEIEKRDDLLHIHEEASRAIAAQRQVEEGIRAELSKELEAKRAEIARLEMRLLRTAQAEFGLSSQLKRTEVHERGAIAMAQLLQSSAEVTSVHSGEQEARRDIEDERGAALQGMHEEFLKGQRTLDAQKPDAEIESLRKKIAELGMQRADAEKSAALSAEQEARRAIELEQDVARQEMRARGAIADLGAQKTQFDALSAEQGARMAIEDERNAELQANFAELITRLREQLIGMEGQRVRDEASAQRQSKEISELYAERLSLYEKLSHSRRDVVVESELRERGGLVLSSLLEKRRLSGVGPSVQTEEERARGALKAIMERERAAIDARALFANLESLSRRAVEEGVQQCLDYVFAAHKEVLDQVVATEATRKSAQAQLVDVEKRLTAERDKVRDDGGDIAERLKQAEERARRFLGMYERGEEVINGFHKCMEVLIKSERFGDHVSYVEDNPNMPVERRIGLLRDLLDAAMKKAAGHTDIALTEKACALKERESQIDRKEAELNELKSHALDEIAKASAATRVGDDLRVAKAQIASLNERHREQLKKEMELEERIKQLTQDLARAGELGARLALQLKHTRAPSIGRGR